MSTPPPATFPLGPFAPSAHNPILEPRGDGWESANLYNPAALVVDDEVVLLYRAHGEDLVSRIGIARSADGVAFTRGDEPVLVPEHDYEAAGCEDPRIVRIDGTFYLTYTGFSGSSAQLCLATSKDLRTWDKHGPLFPEFNTWGTLPYGPDGPWSKAGVIWPEPIDGVHVMFFGEGAIYTATSTDLLHWTPSPQDRPLHRPSGDPERFDATLVEIGAPPVATPEGLLVLLINGAVAASPQEVDYRCGQLAVAQSDPTRLLAHTDVPWLQPITAAETSGMVSNVTFVEGLVHFRGRWLAYYGQADTRLAVAIHDPAEDSYRPRG
jgi:predicted GH43/DUF377 family glycosyl hydrolase